MAYIGHFEEEGAGFSAEEIQSVARRQLVGSLVAAIIIALAAGLMAIKSNAGFADSARYQTMHAAPQQMAAQSAVNVGAPQRQIELP